MANITTILGTDSVSSSRIVINNNFAALNSELLDIAGPSGLLDVDAQTLTLTGLITGGTLRINNGADLFKVESNEINAYLPIKLNQEVTLGKGLIYSIYPGGLTVLPLANAYDHTTYVLDATNPVFSNPVILSDADNGQEFTLVSIGGIVEITPDNIIGTDGSDIIINDGGTLTLRYITAVGLSISGFAIISSSNCTISYP